MDNNPFDYINKKERDEKKRERERQQKLEEALNIQKEERQRVEDKKEAICKEYDKIVSPILQQLIAIAYPSCIVLFDDYISWKIGMYVSYWNEPNMSGEYIREFSEEVTVYLHFDYNNKPINFLCCRNGSYSRQKKTFWGKKEERVYYGSVQTDGLSREELLQALKQLHPKEPQE